MKTLLLLALAVSVLTGCRTNSNMAAYPPSQGQNQMPESLTPSPMNSSQQSSSP